MSGLWSGTSAIGTALYGYGRNATGAVMADRREKVRKTSGTAPLLTDDQILEMRALSQFASWSRERLMARFGVDAACVDRYLSGITRARLVATRQHLPQELRQ